MKEVKWKWSFKWRVEEEVVEDKEEVMVMVFMEWKDKEERMILR